MRRRYTPVLLAGLLLGSTPPCLIAHEARIARVESGLAPAVRHRGAVVESWTLASRLEHHRVPGVSVAVIDQGALAWARGYGTRNSATRKPVSTTTLFRGASLGKPISAFAAFRLVDAGRLSLDADLNDFLVAWKVAPATPAQPPVTLRFLLSHCSGLSSAGAVAYPEDEPMPTLLEVLNGRPPARAGPIGVIDPPGTTLRYGPGYVVLEQLLSDIAGVPFDAVMQQQVLGPLAMTNTSFARHLPADQRALAAVAHTPEGNPLPTPLAYATSAGAGIWTTPTEVARLLVNLLVSLHGESGLLSPTAARTMVSPGPLRDSPWTTGFHRVEEGGEPRLSHGGNIAGFKSLLVLYPASRRGAVVMTNGENGGRVIGELMRAIAREYRWPGYQTVEKRPIALNPDALDAFVGRFERSDGTLSFKRDGSHFFVEISGQGLVELFAEGRDTFYFTEGPDIFEFSDAREGRAWRVLRRGVVTQEFLRRE